MYRTLQLQHSLFLITEQELHLFQQHASSYSPKGSIEHVLAHNSLDNWSTVFNIWLLFYQTKQSMLDYNKMMAYRCNFYCLELLATHPHIRLFLQEQPNDKKHFLTAYYLAEQLLLWVYHMLLLDEEGQKILHKNVTRNYYLLESEQDVTTNPTHEVYKEQRLITSLMVADYAQHPTFEQHIQQAISLTKQQLAQATYTSID